MKVRVEKQGDETSILDGRKLECTLQFKFKEVEKFWEHQIQIEMNGMNAVEFGIPGRLPHEVEYIRINCVEHQWDLPGEVDNNGELKTIVIYDGKRSYWTHRLRQKAMGYS